MTDKTCGNCKYWDTNTWKITIGKCRRYPPPHKAERLGDHSWPATYSTDWCGEWSLNTTEKELVND